MVRQFQSAVKAITPTSMGFPISIQSQHFFFCITCWWVFIVMCRYHVSMRFTWVSAGETCRLSQTLAHTQSQDALSDSDFPAA